MVNNLGKYISKFINLKVGFLGAMVMGTIVFFINLNHGWLLATTAGIKQGLYTFLFGGIIVKLLEYSLVKTRKKSYSIIVSVAFVSLITTFLVFLVHSLKGTPEPIQSTAATIILGPPGFLYLSFKFKKEQENELLRQNEANGFK